MTRGTTIAATAVGLVGLATLTFARSTPSAAPVVPAPNAARPAADPPRKVDDSDVATEITPRVVAAVQKGLRYLAAHQQKDGSWLGDVGFKLNDEYSVQEANVPHVGSTALAGMAFLAGGHMPDRGEFGPTLDRAISFLIHQQNDRGFITAHQSRMYDHAFATLFLAEIFGQTARSDVRTALQHAVDLITRSQNQKGSWRYQPFAIESDMSITVCQLMALRAARNVGIRVPKETIQRAVDYVLASQVKHGDEPFGMFRGDMEGGYYELGAGAFRYQFGEEDVFSRSSFALTAAGITSLYHAARYDTSILRDSLSFLERTMEHVSGDSRYRCHYFYWYGHYYACQAMFITGEVGGIDYWKRYWRRISSELLEVGTEYSQSSEGAWPNRVGPGPNFATAIACIVLQVPYRYLPILQR